MSTQRNILNLFVRAVLCDNIFGGPTECLTRPEVLTEVDGSIDNFYYVIVLQLKSVQVAKKQGKKLRW
jgi:hypothetical protein